MKRVILATLFLATLFVLPAISQTSGDEVDSAEAIATLTEKLEKLQETVDAQGTEIRALQARLEVQAAEAKKLVAATNKAEREGMLLPAPNNAARAAFLFGVRRYATVVTGGSAKGSLDDDIKRWGNGAVPNNEDIPNYPPKR